MSELFERLASQPIRSVGPANIRNIDFAAGREAVRTSEALVRAMDRITNFAFEKAKETQITEGQQQGAADPRRALAELEDKDPSSFNFRDQAAFGTAVKALTAEVEVEAKKAMGLEMLESQKLGETPEQLAERLDMVTLGYADALALMDPASAKSLSLNLENYRNSQYLNFSEDHIKKQKQTTRAEGAIKLDMMNESLENLARSQIAGVDELIEETLNSHDAFLAGQDFSAEEIARERIASKKKAVIARSRGEFDRLTSVEERLNYAEAFEESIGKDGGLARGMSDATAQTLAKQFKTLANADKTALNSEIAVLSADIKLDVSSVVTAGGVPGDGVVKKLRARVNALEEQGGNKEKIAALKDRLARAEGNIEYFKGIQGYNIEQLAAEKTRLEGVKDTAATPDDILRLKVVKSRLSPMLAEATAQNATWKTAATAVGKGVDALEKVVKRFDPIRDEDLEAVTNNINDMEEAGAPPEMIQALRQDVARLKGMSEFFNDIADDSSMTLEDKIAALGQKAQEGGLSTDESEILDAMDKRLTAMRTALKSDPMSWANGAGVVSLEVNVVETILAGSDQDAIEASVAMRVNHANKVAGHYQIPRKILTQSEATSLATALEEAPIEAQAGLLKRVVDGFGANALDALSQISKDAPELAHIGGLMASGASDDIINAAMLGKVIKAGKEDRALGEMTDQRDMRMVMLEGLGQTEGMVKTVDRLKSVADLIYLGRGGSTGATFDRKLYEQALQEAAGQRMVGGEAFGGITEYNRRNIILPSNIRNDDGVDDVFDNMSSVDDLVSLAVTQDDNGNLVNYDQAPIGVANQTAVPLSVIKKANLISVGDGVYKLAYEGNVLFAPNSQPYLIDLKKVNQ
mgnify:CR=1 FL=1